MKGGILITGQRGFIGRRLRGFLESNRPHVNLIDPPDPIPFHDVQLLTAFLSASQPKAIFHLAAHRGEAASLTRPLLEALFRLQSSTCLVLPGSAAEYGRVPPDQLPVAEEFSGTPLTAYGVEKQAQTRLASDYARKGLQIVVARIFNIIGRDAPAHTLIGSFLSKIRAASLPGADRTMRVGDLNIKRDFVDLDDVCSGLASLARSGTSGEAYNICSGQSVALHSVLNQMIRASGIPIQVVADSPLIPPNPVKDISGSPDKIHAATGWSPRYTWKDAVARLFS
jgi:GDP-4-dehydro-6-deoxy-D-mannose reductase